MKSRVSLFITIICLLTGLIFYAYQQEWIIIALPYKNLNLHQPISSEQQADYIQKKVILYFWKNNRWHQESQNIIWSSELTSTIQTITHNWLLLLEDEKLLDNDTQLISAFLSEYKELFVSFNKNLCHDQQSTFHKLMLIQSYLKTLHENKLPVQKVRFLVHHQTMTDDHLNFTISWPITGYASLL